MKSLFVVGLLSALLAVALVDARSADQSGPPQGVVKIRKHDTRGGWLGVRIQDMTKKLARKNDMKTDEGVYVNGVEDDSPADSAGIHEGDVIVEYDGKRIDNANDLTSAVRKTKPGTDVTVVLMRKNEKKSLRARIGQAPRTTLRPFAFGHPGMHMFSGSSMYGLSLLELNPQLGEYFDAPGGKGVLVEKVKKNSVAEKAGFKAGDVITKVGKETVTDVEEIRHELDDYKDGEKADFEVLRKGARKTLTLEVDEEEGGDGFHFRFNRPHEEDFDFEVLPPDEIEGIQHEGDRIKIEMKGLKESLETIKESLRQEMKDLERSLKQTFGRSISSIGTRSSPRAPKSCRS
jgi:membrane-associated protease RseP (regulator of RpoE activity)